MRDNLLLRKGILYYGHDDLRISRSAPLERRSKQKTSGRTRGRVHPFGSVAHHPFPDLPGVKDVAKGTTLPKPHLEFSYE
jgi:hypothetical protein